MRAEQRFGVGPPPGAEASTDLGNRVRVMRCEPFGQAARQAAEMAGPVTQQCRCRQDSVRARQQEFDDLIGGSASHARAAVCAAALRVLRRLRRLRRDALSQAILRPWCGRNGRRKQARSRRALQPLERTNLTVPDFARPSATGVLLCLPFEDRHCSIGQTRCFWPASMRSAGRCLQALCEVGPAPLRTRYLVCCAPP